MLSQHDLYTKVTQSVGPLALIFFGVALQVFGVILNKYCAFAGYSHRDDWPLGWLRDVSYRIWIDITVDLVTLALFASGVIWATISITS